MADVNEQITQLEYEIDVFEHIIEHAKQRRRKLLQKLRIKKKAAADQKNSNLPIKLL